MWQLPPGITPEEILDYLRKSRTDDPALTVEEVLERHEQMLDDWVERNLPGLGRVPEENRYREVVSGETIASRPRMQELLRRIESPKIKAVLIKEPERLSRGDLEDIGRLVKLFKYTKTLVITLDYIYDLRDDGDRDRFERELKRGNEFLEYQKKIMGAGRQLSVERGNFVGQHAPWGYNKIRVKEGKKYCFTLEPDPEKAPIVRQIFEWYSQGLGSTTIANRLEELHIKPPKGPAWRTDYVYKMFTNEHYIGKVVWNKRKEVRKVVDGEIIVSRPKAEEYLIYPGKHEAIIPQELWDKVQEIRGRLPKTKKDKKPFNPLAGLMYCANCGTAITGRTYNSKEGVERCLPRYLCHNQTKCGTASASMDQVLAQVVEVLREAIADFEIRIEAGTDDSHEVHQAMVTRLEKRLAELRELEIKQWDEKTKGGMPQHVFERLNSDVLHEIDEVQDALCTAQGSVPEPINLQEKLTAFREALEAVLDPDAPILEKNLLLKACIDRIEYSRERTGLNGHPVKGEEKPVVLDITLRI